MKTLRYLLAILMLGMALAGCAGPRSIMGVPNFVEMDKGVYRGGQPSPDGWIALKKLGIKTVIRLDKPEEGANDEEQAKELGIEVVVASVPPSKWSERYEYPSPEKVEKAIKAMSDESQRSVYVHCLHGQDRTGFVVGIYRVLHDHYSKEQAYKEMLDNGFHPFFSPGMVEAWGRFDGKSLSSLD